jgi:hypothetical protein
MAGLFVLFFIRQENLNHSLGSSSHPNIYKI